MPTCIHRTPSYASPNASGNGEQTSTIQCYLVDDVHLQTEDDILSFTNLMTSYSGSCSSLCTLRISTGKVGSAAAAALVSLLSRLRTEPSIRFVSLEFDGDTEGFLSSSPELPGAIADLTTLKTLRVDPVGKLGANMLLKTKSSLVAAELFLDVIPYLEDVPILEERRISNPIFLLQGSQNTLEKLKASCALTDDNVSYDIHYPCVRELDLDSLDVPLTYDYVLAFPNLSRLSVSSVRFSGKKDVSGATRYRNANKQDQDDYGTWDALDAVSCSVLDAYLLALRCPVSTLQLSLNGTGQSQEWTARMLQSVLDDVYPTVLRLTTGSPRILLKPSLMSALSPERTRQLETLIITYEVIVRDTASIVQEALMWMLQELMPAPITTFELEIDCKNAFPAEAEVGDADGQYVDRGGGGYFVNLDLRELAREFMSFIETARLVRISLRGHRFRKDTSVVREYDSSEDLDSDDAISEDEDGEDEVDDEEEGEDDEDEEHRLGEDGEHIVNQLDVSESSQQEVEMMITVEG